MSTGRGWWVISILSGVVAVVLFAIVVSAVGGNKVSDVPLARPTPGQPVDTELLYAPAGGPPPAVRSAAPSASPEAVQTTGQTSAPDSAAASGAATPGTERAADSNPFTSGLQQTAAPAASALTP